MASDQEFKHESIQDCQTIVKYLQALSDGFENKKLNLSSDGRNIIVTPGGLLKMEVKARKKADRVKLTLKLSWTEPKESELLKRNPLSIEAPGINKAKG